MTIATFHDLKDASVIITGGGSGIGAKLSAGFAEQGAKVAIIDRIDASGLAAEIGATTAHIPIALQCDVTDTAAFQKAIHDAAAVHGGLDVLVNNAANDMRMDAMTLAIDDWDAMQDINLKPYFFGCQAAAKVMGEKGAIINFSSTSYMIGGAGMAPYVAANAGIIGLTRSLAREWGPNGIRVNAIAPGWVLTEKQLKKWATPESLAAFLDRQCIKVHMQPQDVVAPVLFLASDASAMMTSQTMVVDAGVSMTG
jgi:NAD(P)-dependent dehydrogenase (short-subunit alcohol dehydrogenase family)